MKEDLIRCLLEILLYALGAGFLKVIWMIITGDYGKREK